MEVISSKERWQITYACSSLSGSASPPVAEASPPAMDGGDAPSESPAPEAPSATMPTPVPAEQSPAPAQQMIEQPVAVSVTEAQTDSASTDPAASPPAPSIAVAVDPPALPSPDTSMNQLRLGQIKSPGISSVTINPNAEFAPVAIVMMMKQKPGEENLKENQTITHVSSPTGLQLPVSMILTRPLDIFMMKQTQLDPSTGAFNSSSTTQLLHTLLPGLRLNGSSINQKYGFFSEKHALTKVSVTSLLNTDEVEQTSLPPPSTATSPIIPVSDQATPDEMIPTQKLLYELTKVILHEMKPSYIKIVSHGPSNIFEEAVNKKAPTDVASQSNKIVRLQGHNQPISSFDLDYQQTQEPSHNIRVDPTIGGTDELSDSIDEPKKKSKGKQHIGIQSNLKHSNQRFHLHEKEIDKLVSRKKRNVRMSEIPPKSNKCERAYVICITQSRQYIITRLNTKSCFQIEGAKMDCSNKHLQTGNSTECSCAPILNSNDHTKYSDNSRVPTAVTPSIQVDDELEAIIIHD
ncbi:hypothetical protein QAD02_021967 [Eretmocerus hayati]|uniref:Uncharacterized protein n=1 Tax=Eretmocerus hayati TaxID=131215 RepID=A0ACC2PT60_9HYME|nr:hypothetical protein QAD02_021967 [Eretmocerus hayati]